MTKDIGKIKLLKLENVACFRNMKIEFSDGLNVFIGKDSTGKTIILKLIYSILMGLSEALEKKNPISKRRLGEEIGEKMARVFQVGRVGRLSSRKQGNTRSKILLKADNLSIEISFSTRSEAVKIESIKGKKPRKIKPIFLPSKEILSIFKGLREVYENREFEIEETYIDLARKLALPPRKGKPVEREKALFQFLSEKSGIKQVIKKDDDHFYLKFSELGNSELEAPLVAEGFRKFATLLVLIRNGILSNGSFLFWDEPEANLNPSFSKEIAEFMKMLVESGVQIFTATHDYFIPKFCDFSFEEKSIKFFSLFKEEKGENIGFSEATKFTKLKNNVILDEFIKLYLFERKKAFIQQDLQED